MSNVLMPATESKEKTTRSERRAERETRKARKQEKRAVGTGRGQAKNYIYTTRHTSLHRKRRLARTRSGGARGSNATTHGRRRGSATRAQKQWFDRKRPNKKCPTKEKEKSREPLEVGATKGGLIGDMQQADFRLEAVLLLFIEGKLLERCTLVQLVTVSHNIQWFSVFLGGDTKLHTQHAISSELA